MKVGEGNCDISDGSNDITSGDQISATEGLGSLNKPPGGSENESQLVQQCSRRETRLPNYLFDYVSK